MSSSRPHLDFLSFDASGDTDGLQTFDALASTSRERHAAVLAEVAAGNPVLVLQNLAFDFYPQWHFAVVVGYDRRERTLILRSGTTRRLVDDFASFDQSWARGGRWAVLALPPSAF